MTIFYQVIKTDILLYLNLIAEEMDQADAELKETIKTIWPLQAKNMIELLVPPNDQLNTGKLTVGKIYGGLLILESWKSTRFGQIEPTGLPVRRKLRYIYIFHGNSVQNYRHNSRTFNQIYSIHRRIFVANIC